MVLNIGVGKEIVKLYMKQQQQQQEEEEAQSAGRRRRQEHMVWVRLASQSNDFSAQAYTSVQKVNRKQNCNLFQKHMMLHASPKVPILPSKEPPPSPT